MHTLSQDEWRLWVWIEGAFAARVTDSSEGASAAGALRSRKIVESPASSPIQVESASVAAAAAMR